MAADILIVGQGLAGTMLAWEFERAGIAFQIVDAGHAEAATRVAAGIVNPITGQRIVKSWKVDALLPVARESFCAFEKELRVPLWREMKVRRLYVNDAERRIFQVKQARGDLAGYVRAGDEEGFWIEGAARVDLGTMLVAARTRWLSAGVMREQRVDFATVREEHDLVIDCTGSGRGPFGFVAWQYSKGECLTVAMEALAPDIIINRGHWVLPCPNGRAKVGATHGPGRCDAALTPEARSELEASLATMCSQRFVVTDHQAGVRTYLSDKRPVVGRHPADSRVGIVNGLGGKGTLFAPALARQWVNHLRDGVPFDQDVDVARLWRQSRGAALMERP